MALRNVSYGRPVIDSSVVPGGAHAASAVTMACVPLTIERRASARSAPKIRASSDS